MSINLQPDLFNQELVQEKEGELLVSSAVVAENVGYEHRAVIQLVRQNLSDLEEFGRVTFEMRPFDTKGGSQIREIALLNENQSTLLITYMRNNDLTKRFKTLVYQKGINYINKFLEGGK